MSEQLWEAMKQEKWAKVGSIFPPTWFLYVNLKQNLNVTCPGEGGDGAKAECSAEAPRQRRGGRLALARTLLAVDELGEVRGRGGDEGVCQVRGEQRRLAAEGRYCKVSATQEQCNGPLNEIKMYNKTVKRF